MNKYSSETQINTLDRKLIPSLSTLIIFECAATHSSFIKAAKELKRTPSAISRSIKELEERLRCTLFERDGKKVSLTANGSFYLYEVRKALKVLQDSENFLSDLKSSNLIRLQVPPTFASYILIPNLSEFQKKYQNIKIDLQVDQNHVNWSQQNSGAEVRLCGVKDSHLFVQPLGSFKVVPICSPDFLSGSSRKLNLDNISQYTFLHFKVSNRLWGKVLRKAGCKNPTIRQSLSFNSSLEILEAVRNGLGIGLGVYPFIKKFPDYGKSIIMPFGPDVSNDLSYSFVCKKSEADSPKMQNLLKWLQSICDNEQIFT